MNKTDLIAAIAEKSGLTKKDSEKAVTAMLDSIIEAVVAGDKVQLVGFGTFEKRQRSERIGVDPRTKERISIPASKIPAFKAGRNFKDAVNK
ncbi:MAG: HU family DNA-binding protein [Acutalibacteraceae bacterium]|nr:HU family DNA-binding protein [Acutalibacteraceae bacterium]